MTFWLWGGIAPAFSVVVAVARGAGGGVVVAAGWIGGRENF